MRSGARIIALLSLALLAQCGGDVTAERPETNRGADLTGRPIAARVQPRHAVVEGCIDTSSFTQFWSEFRQNVARDARGEVARALGYPILGGDISLFEFSIDCDEDRLVAAFPIEDLRIDESSIMQHYEFIFSDTMRSIIAQVSPEEMVKNGWGISEHGLIYSVFARDYVRAACLNDKTLQIRIERLEGEWRVRFTTCC